MRLKETVSLLLSAVLAVGMFLLPTTAAEAAGRVQVDSPAGAGQVYVNKATTVTLRGSGFQSINKGFGGIYVLFGWVGNGWKPSQGGVAGTNYRYVPDSENKNNRGYMKFVSFPGSETQDAANGGLLNANGTWSTQLTIPGPIFVSVDRNGTQHRVDCRQVQCGIITIGAHGVKNPANESFTPLKFVGGKANAGSGNSRQPQQQTQRAQQAAKATATQGQTPRASNSAQTRATSPQAGNSAANNQRTADANPANGDSAVNTQPDDPNAVAPADGDVAAATLGDAKPTVGLLDKKIMQGKVLSFTAQGFTPGEQVVGTLDTGSAAAGPFIAGQLGDLAGTVPLEATIRPGTHVLTLTGAVSKTPARVTFTVEKNTDLAANIDAKSGSNDLWSTTSILATLGVVLVAIVLLVSAITALIRRRKTPPAATAVVLAIALVGGFGLVPHTNTPAFADEVDVTVTIPEKGDPGANKPGTPGNPAVPGDGSEINAGELNLSNASLRWGINPESSSGSFFGGCNFIVAGKVGDLKSSHVWSQAELQQWYKTEADHVKIMRHDHQPTLAERCQHENGSALTTMPSDLGAGSEVVMSGGTGTLNVTADGKATGTVNWPGSFSVVFYGGMTYWWASDLQLEIAADSSAKLTAEVGGYGASMEDTSKWEALRPRRVTLAEFKDVKLTKNGFTATPTYAGRDVSPANPVNPQDKSLPGWGSFPIDFIKFHNETGQSSYWYTSGGIRDKAKSPSPMTVSWDAASPVTPPTPTPGSGTPNSGNTPNTGVPDPSSFLPDPSSFLPPAGELTGTGDPLGNLGRTTTPGGAQFIPNPDASINQSTSQAPAPLNPGYAQPAAPVGGYVPAPGEPLAVGAADNLAGSTAAADPATATTAGNPIETAKQALAKAPQWVGQNLIPATKATVSNEMPTALTLTALFLVLLAITAVGFKAGWLILPGTKRQEAANG